ncbi:hypothetical protein Cgig2_014850 [Carnegiea gigantea]|uniref:RING-type E3 ubiquitin transferase n=1 Tax=Carnegiea gigantea TaxID=171969 RepID=A0A9Q1QSP2_9CARY|nr:hypothetical protein Cgig2_014850 [Carnegiea gigantea]
MAGMNNHGADESVIDLNSTLHDNVNQDTTSLSKGPDGLNIAESSRGNTGPTEDLILKISDHTAPSEFPGLSAGSPEDNHGASKSSNISGSRDLEFEPRLSLGPSPNNVSHSLRTPDISRPEKGASSAGGSALSGKGKEVQVPEAASSSCPRQMDSNRPNGHSAVHSHGFLPPQTPYQMNFQQHPLRNMAGLHVSPDLVPHQSTTVYPGMPQGYFDQRMHLSGQQNPMLVNALETTNAPLHSEFHPHPASQPMWFNEFAIGSSAPNMSQMMLGPSMWRNVPQFPFTVNSNVRTEVPAERGQVPAMGNISQQPRPQSPAIGNIGAYGSTFTHSELHQWHAPPIPYEPNYRAANQQTLSAYPPWPPSHQNGLGPDAQYIDLAPCLHHTTYGYFLDTMRVPGPGNQSHNPYAPGPSISQSSNHPGRHAVPQTAQPMEVPTNTEDWMIPELYEGTRADQGNASLRVQAETLIGPIEVVELAVSVRFLDLGFGRVLEGFKTTTCICVTVVDFLELILELPLEEYVGGEVIGMVDCGHEFHPDCIKQWLVLKNQCPVCKTKALA